MRELIRNFTITDDWCRVPIFGIAVKYLVHRDGRIVSLPNKEYIERLESYGRPFKYDTATVIQNSPKKKDHHGDRVTLCIGRHNGKNVNNSFLRQNVVWASWHNAPEMLTIHAIKYQPIVFKDGNIHNCAIDNLEERKDYCQITDEFTEAYRREWKWILSKLWQEKEDNRISFDTLRDIVSETFILSLVRLQDENNDSHRIGLFWYKAAKRLLSDVTIKKMPVDYYTRRFKIAPPYFQKSKIY